MKHKLEISQGFYSNKGIKEDNDDALAIHIPEKTAIDTKGIVALIADGMSSSEAGKEASQTCINGFINDYYSTPDSWTVVNSAQKILSALNNWLHARGHSDYQSSKGMVTTLSVLIIKSRTAHIFHVGDSRIYRYRDDELEQLTTDHRIWASNDKSYLNRAMGIDLHLDIDYKKVAIEKNDIFLLSTDGIHDFIKYKDLKTILSEHLSKSIDNEGLQYCCDFIANCAIENNSDDNLSLQLLGINNLPLEEQQEIYAKAQQRPFPPPLEPGLILDGYQIIKELHASNRTQIYQATKEGQTVIIKTPSLNYADDVHFIEQFLYEEWAGKRIDSPYILKVIESEEKPTFLYYITEFVDGITLREWMQRNPKPSPDKVIAIIEQIIKGLRSLHRLEMLHQDLKPENIMLNSNGQIKIIDFGSIKIAGIAEQKNIQRDILLGTVNYAAPEYFLGQSGDPRADLYSLAVICYEMLNNHLPFGKEMPENPSQRQLSQLKYAHSVHFNPMVPNWMDGAIEKALSLSPKQRHEDIDEFLYDLKNPNPNFINKNAMPLIERDPLFFWQSFSGIMLIINLILIYQLLI